MQVGQGLVGQLDLVRGGGPGEDVIDARPVRIRGESQGAGGVGLRIGIDEQGRTIYEEDARRQMIRTIQKSLPQSIGPGSLKGLNRSRHTRKDSMLKVRW